MTAMITAMAAMTMVANNNMVEATKMMQQAMEIRETEKERKIENVYSYKAEKEVKENFEIYMVNDDPYEYVITFRNGSYVKGDVNSIVSAINRNSKYTAMMQNDELALIWSGNNCILIGLDDDDSDTEYYWTIYNGVAID